jgi:hypothetical protein
LEKVGKNDFQSKGAKKSKIAFEDELRNKDSKEG